MTTMITEVYDALVSAGADDGKARRAAEVMAGHEDRFDGLERHIDAGDAALGRRIDAVEVALGRRIDAVEVALGRRIDALQSDLQVTRSDLGGRITLLQWQLALLIGGVVAILLKLFVR